MIVTDHLRDLAVEFLLRRRPFHPALAGRARASLPASCHREALPPHLAAIPGRSASVPPTMSDRSTMTLASVSLVLIASALSAVLAQLDVRD